MEKYNYEYIEACENMWFEVAKMTSLEKLINKNTNTRYDQKIEGGFKIAQLLVYNSINALFPEVSTINKGRIYYNLWFRLDLRSTLGSYYEIKKELKRKI